MFFDPALTFSEHISFVCSSASKFLSFLIRFSHNFSSTLATKTLYFALVQNILEYANLIWYTHTYSTYEILSIERMQKRFLKYYAYRISGHYPQRGSNYTYIVTGTTWFFIVRRSSQ